MSQGEQEQDQTQSPIPGGCTARALVGKALTILLAATAFAWLLCLLIDRAPLQGAWTLQVMLALATLLCSCWNALTRRRLWVNPLRQLESMIPQARDGKMPIEQLSLISGGIAPVVPLIQDLLRDLLQQKADVAKLEADIRQRIASRTDTMQRTIVTLRQQATRDGLTGLFNRRFMDQYLPQATQRCHEDNTELCLLMIDVDHFKLLNDTLGHAAGDELLRAIGELIRAAVRGEDIAFRRGGDEFVILLPGCGMEAGQALAGRLTSLVDALSKTLPVPKPPRLSIGLSTLARLETPSADNLLAEADRDLYAVKAIRHGLGARTGADAVQLTN